MIYVKLSKKEAYEYSRLLHKLSRPNPDPRDVTTHFCEVREHETEDLAILCIPDLAMIPISKDANKEEFGTLLSKLVGAGEKESVLEEVKEGKVSFDKLIPESLDLASKDESDFYEFKGMTKEVGGK